MRLLREATLEDVRALTALMRETFEETFTHYPPDELQAYLAETYSEARTREGLAAPTRKTWVVEEDGALLAYAVAGDADLPIEGLEKRAGQLHRLYVRKSLVGAGVGRMLMDTALAWLEAQQRSPIYIGVWEHNDRALAFYRRYGFAPVGDYPYPVGSTIDRELILRST